MKQNNAVSQKLEEYLARIPFHINISHEDMGFLLLKSICNVNGSDLIGEEIKGGEIVVGTNVKYRFDGHLLSVAYYSPFYKKIIQKDLRVV